MADSPQLNDNLAYNLQAAIDRKLTVGEVPLMTLAGAHGEGLVVTDHRVAILREQMPIAGQAEVDCFDYPYELIRNVRVDGAVGGGHLVLELVAPPVDDNQVTLCFPSYDLAKFDAAAARIRLLAQHASSAPLSEPASGQASTTTDAACDSCAARLDNREWSYCPKCGASQGIVCRFCTRLLPSAAQYCPHCGASAELAGNRNCSGCGTVVLARYLYCPQCGVSQGPRCARCGGPIASSWKRCVTCGQDLHPNVIVPSSSWVSPQSGQAGISSPQTAEEHNAAGMSLYNKDEYESAIKHFEAALAIEPLHPLYHCNLGVALAETGHDDEAIEHYHTAIGLAPHDPTPYLNLGYFYSERERPDDARNAWQKVIDVAPASSEADEARQNLSQSDEV